MHTIMLANAYSSSADYSIPTSDKIIAESKRAVELAPRQKESYTLIAAAYWNKKDYRAAKLYMDKYIQVNPQAANRPDVVGEQKELAKKLADGCVCRPNPEHGSLHAFEHGGCFFCAYPSASGRECVRLVKRPGA